MVSNERIKSFSYVFHVIFAVMVFPMFVESQLFSGFYSTSCPEAESIVRSTVESHFFRDPTVAPALVRLHFHDCFVQGCDASVLIIGSSAERSAKQNLGLRGFEIIENAKAKLEKLCPQIVSCADIVAMAARDAVHLSDGPSWSVPTGRRDGRTSLVDDAANLPSPVDSIAVQIKKFAAKGLDVHDLVTLADESMNKEFLAQAQSLCPKGGDGSKRVSLDKGSQTKFDSSFFRNVIAGNGVLESDQRLWGDSSTNVTVQNYAENNQGLLGFSFRNVFPRSMVKMSTIGVKVGAQGEIRQICSRFN